MKYFIMLFLILSSINAEAVNCNIHKIYCKIIDLQPSINRSFAMEMSNYLYKYSRIYNTDPFISVAIGMQESSLRNIDRYETVIDKNGRYVKGVSDIGVFQFHVNTVQNFHLNAQRLRSDLEYQVEQHVKLLKRKMRVCRSKGWAKGREWSCYHSYSSFYRNRYYNRVRQYL